MSEFRALFSIVYTTERQKNNKNIENFKNTVSLLELIDIYRIQIMPGIFSDLMELT